MTDYAGGFAYMRDQAGNVIRVATLAEAEEVGASLSVPVYSRTVVLTDAQIKALPTTAIELVPAPGDGQVIRWLSAHAVLDQAAEDYVFPSGASWQLLVGTREDSGLVQIEGADANLALFSFPPLFGIGAGSTLGYLVASQKNATQYDDQPLRIKDVYEGVDDYTGGNVANTLRVTVIYTVVGL